ncbi:Outer membrane efflux protein [Phycisphaerae bacterium RAS2]|nr:Outer membrane efflux protein [Phycisphaerae bacterium RAS2]
MTRRGVSGRAVWLACVAILLTSCARVEHTTEWQKASGEFGNATGVATDWTVDAEIHPLEPGPDNIMSLDSVLHLALSNNRALRADLQTIAQAKADLVQAGLLPNPMLSMLLAFPEGGGRSRIEFGLSQDLASLWLIPSRKKAAQGMLRQRILSFADTAVVLVNDLRSNYYSLQYQVRAVDLQGQNIKLLEDISRILEARLRAGESGQLDVYFIRGRLLEAQLDQVTLRADEQITRQTLMRQMGVANAAADWKPKPLDVVLNVITAPEAELVDAALRQRLDAQAAQWELEASLADFQQQKLRLIPTFGVGLGGERPERRALPGRKILADTARSSIANGALTAPEIESRGQRNQERRQMIDLVLGPTIEVPLPIFDQNQAQVAKAQARTRELQKRWEEVEQRVIEGVRAALIRRRLAEERVRLLEHSLLPQWHANLTVARQTFLAGRESIVTVLLAQETLIRTQLSHAAALRDLETATAALERELSGRIPESLLQPLPTQPAATTQPAGAGRQPTPTTQPGQPGE